MSTGEVLIYDLSESDSVTPLVTGWGGGSGVTCVVWSGAGGSGGVVAAATEGGHVLLWGVSLNKQTMTLNSG